VSRVGRHVEPLQGGHTLRPDVAELGLDFLALLVELPALPEWNTIELRHKASVLVGELLDLLIENLDRLHTHSPDDYPEDVGRV
jgi:hypothetical protein